MQTNRRRVRKIRNGLALERSVVRCRAAQRRLDVEGFSGQLGFGDRQQIEVSYQLNTDRADPPRAAIVAVRRQGDLLRCLAGRFELLDPLIKITQQRPVRTGVQLKRNDAMLAKGFRQAGIRGRWTEQMAPQSFGHQISRVRMRRPYDLRPLGADLPGEWRIGRMRVIVDNRQSHCPLGPSHRCWSRVLAGLTNPPTGTAYYYAESPLRSRPRADSPSPLSCPDARKLQSLILRGRRRSSAQESTHAVTSRPPHGRP